MIQVKDPLATAELLAFVRIVEAKSLSRASTELGVPRATLGRRLTRLEERLGMRLLRRTTRSLALTDAGEAFYHRARVVLDAVEQAEMCVRTETGALRGALRVSLLPLFDDSLLAMISEFAKEHPAVQLQLDFSSRKVDLIRDGFDVAVRSSLELSPGLVARVIHRDRAIAAASPAYLAEHGVPRTVRDLRKHRCLTAFAHGELPGASWPKGRGVVHVESAFSTNGVLLLREAAARGVGIVVLPTVVIADLLESGELVQVLAGVVEAENRIAVVYPDRALLPAHVRAFIEMLVNWSPAAASFDGTRRTRPRRRAS